MDQLENSAASCAILSLSGFSPKRCVIRFWPSLRCRHVESDRQFMCLCGPAEKSISKVSRETTSRTNAGTPCPLARTLSFISFLAFCLFAFPFRPFFHLSFMIFLQWKGWFVAHTALFIGGFVEHFAPITQPSDVAIQIFFAGELSLAQETCFSSVCHPPSIRAHCHSSAISQPSLCCQATIARKV